MMRAYPPNAYPAIAGSGNVAAATAACTLAAMPGFFAFLSGFELTAAGATAATSVQVTVSGIYGGSRIYIYGVPAGAGVPASPLIVTFDPPIPAATIGTGITVSCPSLGTGNLLAAVVAHGFYSDQPWPIS